MIFILYTVHKSDNVAVMDCLNFVNILVNSSVSDNGCGWCGQWIIKIGR